MTIQKNWQELIKPTKLEIKPGDDPRFLATVVAEPLEQLDLAALDRARTALDVRFGRVAVAALAGRLKRTARPRP